MIGVKGDISNIKLFVKLRIYHNTIFIHSSVNKCSIKLQEATQYGSSRTSDNAISLPMAVVKDNFLVCDEYDHLLDEAPPVRKLIRVERAVHHLLQPICRVRQ